MRVSVCVGNYAETPYCISELGMNVYCIEELCYLLKENTYVLDAAQISENLVDWIDKECGLHELARILNAILHRKDSFIPFVATLLQYVGLYEDQTIQEVQTALKEGAGLSSIERKKSQIDYLVKKKRYTAAVKNYDLLIDKWYEEQEKEQNPSVECLAAILHNKGVALAGLMIYDRAAECFKSAYEIVNNEGYYRDFLAAKRLELTEKEYIDFVGDNMDGYEATLDLEHDMENLVHEWEQQPEYLRLYSRREQRDSVDSYKYYEESAEIARILKDSYRNSVL
ncbi:MAG: hypothetical protein MJ114_05230 [Acetatifactor sp.]|nr:hypothetical protein [Acetatifactor sp.]